MPRATVRAEWRLAAIAVPALAAGTLFLLSLALVSVAIDAENLPTVQLRDIPAMLAFLVPATILGFVLALLPLACGVVAMAWLGRWNIAAQLSLAWLLAGAAMPAAFILSRGNTIEEPAALALILTGALCALLARRYVRWTDSL